MIIKREHIHLSQGRRKCLLSILDMRRIIEWEREGSAHLYSNLGLLVFFFGILRYHVIEQIWNKGYHTIYTFNTF